MLTKKQNLTREILTVILLLAAVAATEYWFFQLWRLDWHVPMFYGGDGIYWVGQVQRSYGELSGSLGWPFYEVAGRYDPNYDLIYDIFVWFVGLFTKDTGTVFNLYVLVIPFANALAGYAVFRMVGLAPLAELCVRSDVWPDALRPAAHGRAHDAGRLRVCAVLGAALSLVRRG